jgi:phosphoglycerate dehydrogenase-like enzyme
MSFSLVVPACGPLDEPVVNSDWFKTRTKQLFSQVTVYPDNSSDVQQWVERVRNQDILLVVGGCPRGVFSALSTSEAPKLISFCYTGVETANDVAEIKSKGTVCTRLVHFDDYGIAEHTLALTLACTRKIAEVDREIRAGAWPKPTVSQVRGKTVGILGSGGIGKEYAKMCYNLGAKILVWDIVRDQEFLQSIDADFTEDLDFLLANSQIISIHLPANDSTFGMIKYENLAKINSGSVIINTARAEVVEPGAMYRRLARGDIQGGFDVWEQEPLDPADPMRTLENVVHTSHNAFRAIETAWRTIELGLDNIEAFMQGHPVNIV